jgi:hypothetical protein
MNKRRRRHLFWERGEVPATLDIIGMLITGAFVLGCWWAIDFLFNRLLP